MFSILWGDKQCLEGFGMVEMNNWGIIGGDKRQIYVADALQEDGYNVYAFGFDLAGERKGVIPASCEEIALLCHTIIFPLPVTLDGVYLNAPYAKEKIRLTDDLARLMQGKRVFGGMIHRLQESSPLWEQAECFDYSMREEFAVQNAVPTAEGALEIAIRESPFTLNGSECLVTGYGRIGKVLAGMLDGLGANVTVAARKPADLSWISLHGYQPLDIHKLTENIQFDFIFNTVPALIFHRKLVSKLPGHCLCIELASTPGGFDFEAAEKRDLRIIRAASLPGKIAPKTAGEIIKNTIYNMCEE